MALLRNAASRISGASVQEAQSPIGDAYEPGFFINAVRRQDAVPERRRFEAGFVHGSALVDVCPRQHVLAAMAGTSYRRVYGPERIVWALGRAAESHVRNQYLESVGRLGAYGAWECACKRVSYTGLFTPAARVCVACGEHPARYREAPYLDRDAHISGSPDLQLVNRSGRFLIVEAKSMQEKDFRPLDAPLANHVFQAMLYRRLAEYNGKAVMSGVLVVYVSKQYNFKTPYKEFYVEASPMYEGMLDYAWEQAASIRRGIEANTVDGMDRMCRSQDVTRAKGCPVSSSCFMRRA